MGYINLLLHLITVLFLLSTVYSFWDEIKYKLWNKHALGISLSGVIGFVLYVIFVNLTPFGPDIVFNNFLIIDAETINWLLFGIIVITGGLFIEIWPKLFLERHYIFVRLIVMCLSFFIIFFIHLYIASYDYSPVVNGDSRSFINYEFNTALLPNIGFITGSVLYFLVLKKEPEKTES